MVDVIMKITADNTNEDLGGINSTTAVVRVLLFLAPK